MLNKYLRIFGYSAVIVLMILLSIGTIFRYLADMNFDKARKLATSYGRIEASLTDREEVRKFKAPAMAEIDYYYKKAIGYNFLERNNYARRLNSIYLKELLK